MSAYPESVPGFHLSALIEHLHRTGADCDGVLEAHRLSRESLRWPGARIPRSVMASVLMTLKDTTGRSDLGFEMGVQVGIGA